MATKTMQRSGPESGASETRLLCTEKGVNVELAVRYDPPEYPYRNNVPFGGINYDVFLPDYPQSQSKEWDRGYVGVSFWKAEECFLKSTEREWLAKRGIGDEDALSKVDLFFPLNPESWPREMGVGKSIMKEVVRDSKSSGSSAVCCGTIVDEMKKLLRSRSFAFEEVPKEGSEFFIMSLV